MIRSFTIFLLLTATCLLFPQGKWQLVREPDWKFPMARVLFRSVEQGFIKSNQTHLLVTENSGDSWQNTEWPDSVWNPQEPWNMLLTGFWQDMEFGEHQDVWLVGDEGYLLHIPANGGAQRFITIPDRPMLRAGYFKVENLIWLAGYYGQIFYSNNGGKNIEQRYNFHDLLWDISFTDSLNGVVLARTGEDSSRCYRTLDGGFNWELISHPDVHGRRMFFLDETHGWIKDIDYFLSFLLTKTTAGSAAPMVC